MPAPNRPAIWLVLPVVVGISKSRAREANKHCQSLHLPYWNVCVNLKSPPLLQTSAKITQIGPLKFSLNKLRFCNYECLPVFAFPLRDLLCAASHKFKSLKLDYFHESFGTSLEATCSLLLFLSSAPRSPLEIISSRCKLPHNHPHYHSVGREGESVLRNEQLATKTTNSRAMRPLFRSGSGSSNSNNNNNARRGNQRGKASLNQESRLLNSKICATHSTRHNPNKLN